MRARKKYTQFKFDTSRLRAPNALTHKRESCVPFGVYNLQWFRSLRLRTLDLCLDDLSPLDLNAKSRSQGKHLAAVC